MSISSIVPKLIESNQSSPFNAIRHFDEKGIEFWKARELQKMLGYAKWQRFEDAIDRAKTSLLNQRLDITNHVTASGKLDTLATLANPKTSEDYKLSRHACYTIAMNGDPRKVEIAQAQSYFVAKTREAEIVAPAQNDQIRLLELKNENLKLRSRMIDTTSTLVGMYGEALGLTIAGLNVG